MEATTRTLRNDYTPELAIIVYRNDGNHKEHFYLESHLFTTEGKLLEGKPLRDQTIRGMVGIFAQRAKEEASIGGDIPVNLLHYSAASGGDYTLCWHRPAEQRTLWFKEQLHIPSGPAMVPPMLYIAGKNSLRVWALKSGERPSGSTRFFHAPFHNVSGGMVCLGSAKAKNPEKRTFDKMIAYWEAMFWNSEFSHLAGSNPIKEGENLNLIWAEQVANPKRPFPLKLLLSAGEKTTLQNLLADVE